MDFENLDQFEVIESEGEIIETEEKKEKENYSNEIAVNVLKTIYKMNDKIEDDLELIALIEGNPRLYAKGNAGYRNVLEKDMAWASIGKALKRTLSGLETKQRWDTLRNLYGGSRRQIVALTKQQGLSVSGKDNVSYENMFTSQSMAIHRFMGRLYNPRKTVSNYDNSTLSASCSSSSSESTRKLPFKPHNLLLTKSRSQQSTLQSEGSTTSPIYSSICNQNFNARSLLLKSRLQQSNSQFERSPTPSLNSSIHSIHNQNLENISKNNESNGQANDQARKRSLKVPKSDMKKKDRI